MPFVKLRARSEGLDESGVVSMLGMYYARITDVGFKRDAYVNCDITLLSLCLY